MSKQVLFLCVALLFFACSDDTIDPIDPNEQDLNEPLLSEQGTSEDLYRNMLDFGFKMFMQIHDDSDPGENILISPLSIETALYMAANAAEDETLEEMRSALEFGDFYPSGINVLFKDLLATIKADGTDKSFLNVSQAAFYDPRAFSIDEDFKSILEDFYTAEVFDNAFNLESINGWANDKTEGRIPKVLDKFRDAEFMFLLNALYFLGDWDKPFPEESTRPYGFEFHNPIPIRPGVPMMNQDAALDHYIGDDLNAVDLKFADQKFAMTFIQTPNTVEAFIDEHSYTSITEKYLSVVNEQLNESRLLLTLPKFEMSYNRELSGDLKAMGMVRAFSEPDAQLAKLGQAQGNIYITRVIHDTFLKIDEKGAEGAAVTTVGFGAESIPPAIVFDRPFLFVLRHVETGIPIFIGKLSDPLVN